MTVDKSWMHLSTRSCTEYINGVENFLEYAFKHSIDGDMKINCPCIDCSNRYRRTRDEVQYHLLFRGIRRDYTTWYLHGEGDSEEEGDSEVEGDDDDGMLYADMFDMIKGAYPQVLHGRESSGNEPQEPTFLFQDWEKMDAIKAKAVSEGTKTNDYQNFHEVVGEPSHGRILGMGIGIKAKDVYSLTSSGKGCSKRCRENFTKEKEDLEARLREEMDSKLAKLVENLEEKFSQKLQSMGIPQQSNIDPTTMDGTSRDEEDNSNNDKEVKNSLEGDSKED